MCSEKKKGGRRIENNLKEKQTAIHHRQYFVLLSVHTRLSFLLMIEENI